MQNFLVGTPNFYHGLGLALLRAQLPDLPISSKLTSSSVSPLCRLSAITKFFSGPPPLHWLFPPPECHPSFSPSVQILPIPPWPTRRFRSSGKPSLNFNVISFFPLNSTCSGSLLRVPGPLSEVHFISPVYKLPMFWQQTEL